MDQEVQHLTNKWEALSSSPSTKERKKRKKSSIFNGKTKGHPKNHYTFKDLKIS
jgi:hypothetical protein